MTAPSLARRTRAPSGPSATRFRAIRRDDTTELCPLKKTCRAHENHVELQVGGKGNGASTFNCKRNGGICDESVGDGAVMRKNLAGRSQDYGCLKLASWIFGTSWGSLGLMRSARTCNETKLLNPSRNPYQWVPTPRKAVTLSWNLTSRVLT